jgi:hypothetical protein
MPSDAMAILFIGGVYRENHRPAASLTNFIRNGGKHPLETTTQVLEETIQ